MSRKYMNGRWCVRCGRTEATPYLRRQLGRCLKSLVGIGNSYCEALDIGCGNGRNMRALTTLGANVIGLDMAGGTGEQVLLGHDEFPVRDRGTDIILANFVLMFLSSRERTQVYREIERVLLPEGVLVVELYPAKDSYTKTQKQVDALQEEVMQRFAKWSRLHVTKNHFILSKQEKMK